MPSPFDMPIDRTSPKQTKNTSTPVKKKPMNWLLLIIIAAVVAVTLFFLLPSPGTPSDQGVSLPNNSEITFTGQTSQDRAVLAGASLEENGVKFTVSIPKARKTDTDQKLTCSELSIVNASTRSITVQSSQWSIQDSQGNIGTPMTRNDDSLITENIDPEDITENEICFDTELDSRGEYVILYEGDAGRLGWVHIR